MVTGPESNVTLSQWLFSSSDTLKWKVCNYSSAINITASRDGVHPIPLNIESIATEPDCRCVMVDGQKGTYHLLVSFNSSVNTTGSGFMPIKSMPGTISGELNCIYTKLYITKVGPR